MWACQVSAAVPFSVIVCLRELRAAQSSADRPLWDSSLSGARSSADKHPWVNPFRAAPYSAGNHRSHIRKEVRFLPITHLFRRCLREAPVLTVTQCTVVTIPQMRDMGTCQDRAARLAIKGHRLPHFPSRQQVTQMGGQWEWVEDSDRVAQPLVSSPSFQRRGACQVVTDQMEPFPMARWTER